MMAAAAKKKPLAPASAESTPQIHSAPADQTRIKRKLELLAERTIEEVQSLIDTRIDANEEVTKDDIAIVEHASTNAIRVFNLGASASQSSASASSSLMRDGMPAKQRAFARLKLIDFGKEKLKSSPPSQTQGG